MNTKGLPGNASSMPKSVTSRRSVMIRKKLSLMSPARDKRLEASLGEDLVA